MKGWHLEPQRHSLAARGCKTGSKRSQRKNVNMRARGDTMKEPKNISEITPEYLKYLEDEYDGTEVYDELLQIANNSGFFKGIRADGEPHLKRGVGGNGIAYMVDPVSGDAKIMQITSIPDATGDPYWTRKQMGKSTRWATEHDKAYILTQLSSFELFDLLKDVINGESFVGSYGDVNNFMDIMLSHQAYWGGTDEEALYHSRKEAWEDFQW